MRHVLCRCATINAMSKVKVALTTTTNTYNILKSCMEDKADLMTDAGLKLTSNFMPVIADEE